MAEKKEIIIDRNLHVETNIKKDDIFIMSSDGFKLNKEELKDFLLLNLDLPSQSLCEKLISLNKKEIVTDDVTLFVIKVI